MKLVSERNTLVRWAEQQGPEKMHAYWQERNTRSIDGLQRIVENPLFSQLRAVKNDAVYMAPAYWNSSGFL